MRICFILDSSVTYQTHFDLHTIATTWDGLLPAGHHLKSPELAAYQQAAPAHVRFVYLVIEKDNKPIGVAYLQLLNFNSKHFDPSVFKLQEFGFLKEIILKKQTHLLCCGNMFRMAFPGFYFANPAHNPIICQVMKHFDKHNEFKIDFSAMLLKDAAQLLPTEKIKENRFQVYEGDETLDMPIRPEWSCFDDYLESLTKKYVQRARKIVSAAEGLTVKKLTIEEIAAAESVIEQLYLNVVGQQKVRMCTLNGRYFTEMKKALGHRFELTGYYLGDQMVAFSSSIFTVTGEMEVHYIGLNYQHNDQYKLYFNILFDGIDEAIRKRLRLLHFGRTSFDAKTSAGATPLAVPQYFRVKSGFPSLILSYFTKWVASNGMEKKIIRNPFKTSHKEKVLLA